MSRRGALRIYLGAAPGVGKTFAMLGEGHRRADRGADVVVGLVNTHGRPQIAALLDGLALVPARTVTIGGTEVDEVDVDTLVARAPHVVLVDDLAHTNAAGSPNTKRWQDVEELLAAGITVLSTVNVQHLESLQDVVQRITGVRESETVPDEVLRRADQVELIDITPEALRRRLAHGHVYGPEEIDAAMANLFQPGSLSALRQMALLWVADQVEETVLRHRDARQSTEPWETRERVVVAVNGDPFSDTVLRRAARIAARSAAELLCVHVLSTGRRTNAPPAVAIAGLRRLAEGVGASFHTIVGGDVPAALLDFARAVNATQLVLGTARRSRLARAVSDSIGARVVQDSGPIDVQLVTHAHQTRNWRRRGRHSAVSSGRRTAGWALGVLLPLTATGIGVGLRDVVPFSTDVVLFFLSTVLAALVGGLGPALLAALGGGLLLNFFLTPPLYTFAIAATENVITLIVMVIVAVLIALVVDRAAVRAQQAAAAGAEAELLASFSRTVLTRPDPLPRLLEKVREAFGLTSVAVLEHRDQTWVTAARAGPPEGNSPDQQADIDVAMEPGTHLIGYGRPLPGGDRRLLEAVGGQALLALRNQRITADAAEYHRRAAANELRTALLSAVGHDLRSPLTSIKAAAAGLRDPHLALTDLDRIQLAGAVEESADRLTALVSNLLDSSRLATGAVTPDIRPVSFDEITAKALTTVDGADRVAVEIDDRIPEVLADPGLLDRVVANVVDNALRHGHGAPVALRASTHAGRVELRVVDSGPGVAAGNTAELFTPFQRLGDRDNSLGLGLGLSVARGFTDAMGGALTAEDTPGGGLTIVVSLPAAASLAITQ